MGLVHSLRSVGHAAAEMNAEVAWEVVVLDRGGPVGHAVHRSGIDMAVVQHQDRAPPPGPTPAVEGFHDGGVFFGQGHGIAMIGPAPALAAERLARFTVLDGKDRAFRDRPGTFREPVEALCDVGGGVRGDGLAEHGGDGLLGSDAVLLDVLGFLQFLDRVLCAGAVNAIQIAFVIPAGGEAALKFLHVGTDGAVGAGGRSSDGFQLPEQVGIDVALA